MQQSLHVQRFLVDRVLRQVLVQGVAGLLVTEIGLGVQQDVD